MAKAKPARDRYNTDKRRNVNKKAKAQKLANKFGHPVKFKIKNAPRDKSNDWETVMPNNK